MSIAGSCVVLANVLHQETHLSSVGPSTQSVVASLVASVMVAMAAILFPCLPLFREPSNPLPMPKTEDVPLPEPGAAHSHTHTRSTRMYCICTGMCARIMYKHTHTHHTHTHLITQTHMQHQGHTYIHTYTHMHTGIFTINHNHKEHKFEFCPDIFFWVIYSCSQFSIIEASACT